MKERVISLRVKESAYKILKDYSHTQGLSVNACLNSIIEAYVEWFIPISSYQSMTLPKQMVSQLFDNIPPEILDKLAIEMAQEAKNVILLSGQKFDIMSVIECVRIISKYLMHGHMQISKDSDNHGISVTARHEVGRNFSYFAGHGYAHFFEQLEAAQVSLKFDSSMIFIEVRLSENDYRALDDILT